MPGARWTCSGAQGEKRGRERLSWDSRWQMDGVEAFAGGDIERYVRCGRPMGDGGIRYELWIEGNPRESGLARQLTLQNGAPRRRAIPTVHVRPAARSRSIATRAFECAHQSAVSTVDWARAFRPCESRHSVALSDASIPIAPCLVVRHLFERRRRCKRSLVS